MFVFMLYMPITIPVKIILIITKDKTINNKQEQILKKKIIINNNRF